MKKALMVLLIVFIIALFVNVYIIIRYTGKILTMEATTEGTLSLSIVERCGDGTCDGSETCSDCPADCGACPAAPAVAAAVGGGGGGGVSPKITRDFSVDRSVIKIMVKQEEFFKTSIKIKNTEDIAQNFQLMLSNSLREFVVLSGDAFYLQAGEEKTIDLSFVSTNETEPAVYTGNLEAATAYKTKQIPIIYSIKSKMVLFDVSLDIPAKYREILPREELLLQLTLFNLGGVGKTDVSVEYIIKDFEGNTIIEESNIVAVETQVSFSKTIILPSDIKPGEYVVIAQVKYDSSVGSSSVIFHIIEKEKPFISLISNKYVIILIGIITFAILFILFLEHERKKMKNVLKIQRTEIKNIRDDIKKTKSLSFGSSSIKRKISQQRATLEKAFDAGYISHDSYEKGKKRLQDLGKGFK